MSSGCAAPPPDLAPASTVQAPVSLELDPIAGTIGWRFARNQGMNDAQWADIDGDGRLDLALAAGHRSLRPTNTFASTGSPLDEVVYVQRNVGRDFVEEQVLQLGGGHTSARLAWADLDLDGDPDLVAAVGHDSRLDSDRGPLVVFTNEDGVLLRTWEGPEGEGTQSLVLVAADLDGDGDPDLVDGSVEGLTVWHNDGGELRPEMIREGTVTDLVAGDRDGDGLPELAVATPEGLLWLANEGGALSPDPVQTLHPGEYVRAVALGDWLEEGVLHPAVATIDAVYVYRDSGEGFALRLRRERLNTAPRSLAWSDVDQDGDLDLVVGWDDGALEVLQAFDSFTGRLLEPAWESDRGYGAVAVVSPGDWDGDGGEDLAVARGGPSSVSGGEDVSAVYEALEMAAKFAPHESELQPRMWTVGDADGDDGPDLALPAVVSDPESRSHGVLFLARVEQGRVELVSDQPVFSLPPGTAERPHDRVSDLAWVDFDGDGVEDILAATGAGAVLLRNAGPTFPATWFEPGGASSYAVAVADVDEDGDPDFASVAAQTVSLFRNDDGVPRLAWTVEVPGTDSEDLFLQDRRAIFAHLDGDGLRQLVITTPHAPGTVVLQAGDDPEQPWVRRSFPPTEGQATVATIDLDGDGDDELHLAERGGRQLIVDAVDGDVETVWRSPVHLMLPGTGVFGAQVTDFDEDGVDDFSSGRVFQGRDGDWIPQYRAGLVGPAWVDADGDGDVDLIAEEGVHTNHRGGPDLLPYGAARMRLARVGDRLPWSSVAYAPVRLEDGPLPVVLQLFDPESDPVHGVRFEFRDWRGGWRPASVDGMPDPATTAPHDAGGVEHRVTWRWADDLADGDAVQLRAVLDRQPALGGRIRWAATAARSAPLRIFLDRDGDGVRETVDPCPLDPADDSLIPGVCDSDALTSGWWCSVTRPAPGGLAALLGLLAALSARRRAAA